MPRATLSFHLPEEADEHKMAVNAVHAFRALNELDMVLRNHLKYESIPEDIKTPAEYAEHLRTRLHEILNDYDITDLV